MIDKLSATPAFIARVADCKEEIKIGELSRRELLVKHGAIVVREAERQLITEHWRRE